MDLEQLVKKLNELVDDSIDHSPEPTPSEQHDLIGDLFDGLKNVQQNINQLLTGLSSSSETKPTTKPDDLIDRTTKASCQALTRFFEGLQTRFESKGLKDFLGKAFRSLESERPETEQDQGSEEQPETFIGPAQRTGSSTNPSGSSFEWLLSGAVDISEEKKPIFAEVLFKFMTSNHESGRKLKDVVDKLLEEKGYRCPFEPNEDGFEQWYRKMILSLLRA